MTPIYLVGKLINPRWVHPAIEANLALGNAKGKGNKSLRRRGLEPIDNPPCEHAMNKNRFWTWFYSSKK